MLNKPIAWPTGHRNPVAHSSLKSLDIDPESLKWREFPVALRTAKRAGSDVGAEVEHKPASAVLEKAKLMISESLSIAPSEVKILIQI
jgi:hypothetical protein